MRPRWLLQKCKRPTEDQSAGRGKYRTVKRITQKPEIVQDFERRLASGEAISFAGLSPELRNALIADHGVRNRLEHADKECLQRLYAELSDTERDLIRQFERRFPAARAPWPTKLDIARRMEVSK